jgi:hypothetical protein
MPTNPKRKSYEKMNARELTKATEKFDAEFVADDTTVLTPAMRAVRNRAKRKVGRPRIGQGCRTISVSIERELLSEADDFAKSRRISRAQLISKALEAAVRGSVGKKNKRRRGER